MNASIQALEQRHVRRSLVSDRAFVLFIYLATLLFVATVLGLFAMLLLGSWTSIREFGFSFLWTSEWNPITGRFGALPMIYGTVVSSLTALVLAGIVGVFGAAYLADFAPRFISVPLSFLIELLAAVPSVVFGLWGLFVLAPVLRTVVDPFLQAHFGMVPLFSGPIFGSSLFTAGILLAIMIIPTISAISRDVIAAVIPEHREGSLALGVTRWETMWHVLLPGARSGIFGACILALGRAFGETIATTMVIGNKPAIAASLFAPSYTLASVVANEFTEATTDMYLSALIELGLLLFVVSMIVNAAARVLTWTLLRPSKGR
ncbi:MAG TPA: phosphate ABC transporter permease subunit PstC [Candidatus Baltobacteraceae bacterium]|jgi:phosphate transport system permease protein|nr:phosphate ABC transporter permease subunit PstC [Candidatus Baltobacteraceae bacterium]